MTCERCESIHEGQRLGMNRLPCGCSCHDKFSTGTGNLTNSFIQPLCTCNSRTTAGCPIHAVKY